MVGFDPARAGLGCLGLRRFALGGLFLRLRFRGRSGSFTRGFGCNRLFGGDLVFPAGPENRSKHDRRKNDGGACQHAALHA